MTELLQETMRKIQPLDQAAMEMAKKRWDSIAKPLHSLGRLEDAVVSLAGIARTPKLPLYKKALIIFCADNGVVEEGVTQTGQEVTAIVAGNFLQGKTCTSIFCRDTGADMFPVDIGMASDVPGMRRYKVDYGTRNMTKEPAMTRAQAMEAIETGIVLARKRKEAGYGILAAGEMGIGNTTSSSAVSAVLTGQTVAHVTGHGAGLSAEGLARKRDAIRRAIALHRPDASDVIDVLSKVGGFDLAGMVGLYLGAAAEGLPVVMDGVISQTAALAAVRLCPQAGGYLLASHASREPAGELLLSELAKEPLLTCDFSLGEGSGAVLLFPLLDSALRVYQEMSTFEEIEVEAYVPYL